MRSYYFECREHNEEIIRTRRMVVRRQKLYLCMALTVITMILSILTGTRFAFAKQNVEANERTKVYKSIVIYAGDTLTSIASEYCSDEWNDTTAYIHEVSRINHLDDDELLIAGNYLIIPYYIEQSADKF